MGRSFTDAGPTRALVGMHATVLNGAVVGEEAVVAAGPPVPAGMVVPPPKTLVAACPLRCAANWVRRSWSTFAGGSAATSRSRSVPGRRTTSGELGDGSEMWREA